jgi:hypothetical protein
VEPELLAVALESVTTGCSSLPLRVKLNNFKLCLERGDGFDVVVSTTGAGVSLLLPMPIILRRLIEARWDEGEPMVLVLLVVLVFV